MDVLLVPASGIHVSTETMSAGGVEGVLSSLYEEDDVEWGPAAEESADESFLCMGAPCG